ncbi:alpha/beta hydrolase family protein [Roseospira visakhapatnamensis]|uniref:Dipeptidyl aminopeptidase/acylaminoacyl peptidase n=1 Tax=Roseospira visakhapatnamensis TaxID=390880 RepID=A0A7W6WAY3_9PROT|nr:alpha/beta fold hydrolase [Roseospira visakhapatnamensis]MBB4266987.1 dipeptidyl aminopeptidase/acylaminoacyl peptidase [Roseospira visakhapatnamensis]
MVWVQGMTVLALGAAGGYAVHKGLHRAFRAPRLPGADDPADHGVQAEGVRLVTSQGKLIFGWYCPPPGARARAPAPGLVAIHGWGGNADGLLPLAGVLQKAGYGLLLLDARCHGRSDDDDFASLPRFAEDLSHGVDWLRAHPHIDPARLAVLGHSVGAGAALLTGSRRRDLAAVISLAAFAHPEEVMRRTLTAWRVPYRPLGWATNRYVERVIGHRFRKIAPLRTVTRQHAPVLLMHGARDAVVPIEDMERLRDAAVAAGRVVESVTLPGATHYGTDANTGESVLDQAGTLIHAFLARHLPAPGGAPALPAPPRATRPRPPHDDGHDLDDAAAAPA